MLQAVPKLSCKANIVIIKAVPVSSKPKTEMISPSEANTVPPGTPGAPTANTPNSKINNTIVPTGGTAPYNILKFDLFNKILYNKLNRDLKGGIFYDSN